MIHGLTPKNKPDRAEQRTHYRLPINRWIWNARSLKSIAAQAAGITYAASPALLVGLVAGDSQRIINPQPHPGGNYFSLAHIDQGRMNTQLLAFNSSPGCQVSHVLERLDISRAAIRIAGIINGINTEENIT